MRRPTLLTSLIALALVPTLLAASTASAERNPDRQPRSQSAKLEHHAEGIFRGAFAGCRKEVSVDAADGMVALVFAVEEDGEFTATASFRRDVVKNDDEMAALVRCMGHRANLPANPFPKPGDGRALIGVKYTFALTDGGAPVLILGHGQAQELTEAEVFGWAGELPGGGRS